MPWPEEAGSVKNHQLLTQKDLSWVGRSGPCHKLVSMKVGCPPNTTTAVAEAG